MDLLVDNASIWTTADQSRFFLIPDDAELREGSFTLRSLFYRRRDVEETCLEPWEISREEAEHRIRHRMGALIGAAGAALTEIAREVTEGPSMVPEGGKASDQGAESPPSTPTDTKDASDAPDPTASTLGAELESLFSGFRDALVKALEELPVQLERAIQEAEEESAESLSSVSNEAKPGQRPRDPLVPRLRLVTSKRVD